MNVRVLITDDHELIRAALVHLFNGALGIEVAAEAADGEELLLKLRTTQVDLLLLDLDMPGESGIDLIDHIRRDYPDLLILILSMHDEVSVVSRAIQAGASGYICKNCSPKILLEAIHKVMLTGKYLSPLMAEKLAYASSSPDPKNLESVLSNRELEVFRLLVEGKSNDEISMQLFISEKTVSAHKTNLLHKLDLKNIVQLVRYSFQHKLFT
ncbi:MAG: response regulator transcription factor [Gallionella sp.]|nr:response regulator transcription factor [Gallionella sp.]